MPAIPIWRRIFVRSAAPDKDEIVDEQFRRAHFTDLFGQFLQQGENTNKKTFHDLISTFWDNPEYTLDTFAVADGAFIEQSEVPGDWFNPHLRFLSLVRRKDDGKSKIFIVGPGDVKNPNRFLQVASWDQITFRFYAVENINGCETNKGWTYQGSSFDAFSDNSSHDSSYLGPFNGHVNGAGIMKELHTPWYHWNSNEHGDFWASIPEKDKDFLKTIPYLSYNDSFDMIKDAFELEGHIKQTVTDWYSTRLMSDFSNKSNGKLVPKTQPANIRRWMAHLLLTTTINIGTSQIDDDNYAAPQNLFFNEELLKHGPFKFSLPTSGDTFRFDIEKYEKARDALRLSLLQEVRDGDKLPENIRQIPLKEGTLGGGKGTDAFKLTTFLEVAPKTEGRPFVALQPSYEDARGVISMHSFKSGLGGAFPDALLSDKAFKAILALDFWNPIYSWRRGLLMQYVPKETNLTPDGKEYDLETNFMAAIRKSPYVVNKDEESPEYQLQQLYDDPAKMHEHEEKLKRYIRYISQRLETEEGILDYLKLAESRRRIYRPLPLNEFGVQLPYAVGLEPDWPYIEMTEKGETQKIPERGLVFLASWIGTLHGYDPRLVALSSKIPPADYPKPHASRCPRSMS